MTTKQKRIIVLVVILTLVLTAILTNDYVYLLRA